MTQHDLLVATIFTDVLIFEITSVLGGFDLSIFFTALLSPVSPALDGFNQLLSFLCTVLAPLINTAT